MHNTEKLLKKERTICNRLDEIEFELEECGAIDIEYFRERKKLISLLKCIRKKLKKALKKELRRLL